MFLALRVTVHGAVAQETTPAHALERTGTPLSFLRQKRSVLGILSRSMRPSPSPLCRSTSTIIPVCISKVLGMFNWDEVETLVCGKPEVDVDLLEVFKGGPWGNCFACANVLGKHCCLWRVSGWLRCSHTCKSCCYDRFLPSAFYLLV